jgi:uncharacterized protein (DUF2249 family)
MNARPARKFEKLDVRPILRKGGEPFPMIIAKIEALKDGEGLELTAPFMPAPLVELLTGQGFQTEMERAEDGSWIVWFWKENQVNL